MTNMVVKDQDVTHLVQVPDAYFDTIHKVPGLRLMATCGAVVIRPTFIDDASATCMACVVHQDDEYPPAPAGGVWLHTVSLVKINTGEIRDALKRRGR